MTDAMGPSLEASLEDLKAVYRVLLEHYDEYPDLVGNPFLESLRELLEEQALAEGVDIEDNREWTRWLHEPVDEIPIVPQRRELLN